MDLSNLSLDQLHDLTRAIAKRRLELIKSTQFLDQATRDKAKELICESLMYGMFNDGMEEEYLMDGMSFVGVDNLSDDELIQEMEECVYPEDDEETNDYVALLMQAVAQREIHLALKK